MYPCGTCAGVEEDRVIMVTPCRDVGCEGMFGGKCYGGWRVVVACFIEKEGGLSFCVEDGAGETNGHVRNVGGAYVEEPTYRGR